MRSPSLVCALLTLVLFASPVVPHAVAQSDDEAEMTRLVEELAGHVKAGRAREADATAEALVALGERVVGPDDSGIALMRAGLGAMYSDVGRLKEAEAAMLRAIPGLERQFGPESDHVARNLAILSVIYEQMGRLAEAESSARRAIAIEEKLNGPGSPGLVYPLNTLGSIQNAMDEHEKARETFARAVSIAERSLDADIGGLAAETKAAGLDEASALMRTLPYALLAVSLENLGMALADLDRFAEAEAALRRALSIVDERFGPGHEQSGGVMAKLGSLAYERGDPIAARRYFEQTLAIYEKATGPESLDTLVPIMNLALLAEEAGDYARAKSLYLRALEIDERNRGAVHPSVSTTLSNLGNLYVRTGEYRLAESTLERALDVAMRAVGEESEVAGNALNNLGVLYAARGDAVRAALFFERALGDYEKALGPESRRVAQSLANLGVFYSDSGEYEKADSAFRRALALEARVLGPEHHALASTHLGIGLLAYRRGDVEAADGSYRRALAILEKAPGADPSKLAVAVGNLAWLANERGNAAEAERLGTRALEISERISGPVHGLVASRLSALATFARARGEIAKAIELQRRGNDVRERDFVRNLLVGSELQKRLYLADSEFELNRTIAIHVDSAREDRGAARAALEAIVRRKGRALDAMTDVIDVVRRRGSAEDRALLDELAGDRARLAALTLKAARSASVAAERESLEGRIDRIESTLSERSAGYRAEATLVTLDAVQRAIPPGALLVEIDACYPIDPRSGRRGARRYVAYVLGASGEPSTAVLGDATAIDAAVAALRTALRSKAAEVEGPARALSKLVVEPLAPLLGAAPHLLVSPDGDLNLVPFAALVDGDGRYLLETRAITYLTSGRDLLRLRERAESRSAPLVVGNPEFGRAKGAAGRKFYFAPLAGTADEVRQVSARLAGARLLTGAEATKAAVVACAAPRVLHVATHGFFLDQSPATPEPSRMLVQLDDARQASPIDDPLVRSGLAFAGANERSDEDESALLTAREAAGLDLWGTKLVVLSACDTGVGEVRSGDGVYGLRRALVLAGSESQVMSLWPVSDEATRDLMIAYYGALEAGKGRGEALREVQLAMLRDPARAHPFFWASFILSGAWD
jgi:CHAT domain-containing protein/tetratricopeptide (TPR) repeat protein